MKIAERVAVVLGGARGIGKAIVEALLEKSAKVCIGDILVQEGETLCMELEQRFGKDSIIFVKCDVTQEQDVKGIFKITTERLGLPEIVVCAAGIADELNWQKCVDINLCGVIRSTLAALDIMRKDKGGKGGTIINVASSAALQPVHFGPVYAATKHGVLGFTLSWAAPAHYSLTGVRLNCICPTAVDTQLIDTTNAAEQVYFPDDFRKVMESFDKLSPAYVAEGVMDLIEDDTINGRAMRISKANGCDFAEFQDQPAQ